jgi:hypothetical protein
MSYSGIGAWACRNQWSMRIGDHILQDSNCRFHRLRILKQLALVLGRRRVREQQGELAGHFVLASQEGGAGGLESAATKEERTKAARRGAQIIRAMLARDKEAAKARRE